jgi:hypothetical protein
VSLSSTCGRGSCSRCRGAALPVPGLQSSISGFAAGALKLCGRTSTTTSAIAHSHCAARGKKNTFTRLKQPIHFKYLMEVFFRSELLSYAEVGPATFASMSWSFLSASGNRRRRRETSRRAHSYSRERKDNPIATNKTPGSTGRKRPAIPRTRNIQPATNSAARFSISN